MRILEPVDIAAARCKLVFQHDGDRACRARFVTLCRFPFLLVDRVIELEPEKYAVGYKNVTINDNFFPGHFPQRAIMPGKQLAHTADLCQTSSVPGLK